MDRLDLHSPVFATYAIAASLMVLKVVSMAWLTVIRMMGEKSGFRAPEDLKRTPFNPDPNPDQALPNERVERVRRIMANDLENVPFFLAAGFLFLFTDPSPATARWLFFGYVASRLAHFVAYFTAQIHEVRATFWTIGSLIVIYMSVRVIMAAFGAAV
ncbi:MAG TPA: MAPEG family protein [Caulobacteraceae bacterium]|nr:MAPEG family protein [Caulobacteraceae bacterium]